MILLCFTFYSVQCVFIVSYFTTMCYVLSTCKRLISPLLYNKFDFDFDFRSPSFPDGVRLALSDK